MKRYLVFLLCFLMAYSAFDAHGRKRKGRGLPRTEAGLMTNVLGCLQFKDSISYYNLFVPFDTLWQMVIHNADRSSDAQKELDHLKEHPQALIVFDPHFNSAIMAGFYKVIQKGEDSGIHWDGILMQRYELKKDQTTNKDLIGYDRISPERFRGYLFVRDMLGRLTFCIAISEIHKIRGYFYGGQVTNILEASTVEQYHLKEKKEQEYFDWLAKNPDYDSLRTDSLRTDSIKRGILDTFGGRKTDILGMNAEEDEKPAVRKQVIDRKYYEGMFDNEIPVKLYIRYMKDPKAGGKVVSYDGLYKFGDQTVYAKLSITREDNGKWLMEDDPPVGILELELKEKIYTGSWTNAENQTGYDVLLKEKGASQSKVEQFDNMLEKGLTGRVDEDNENEKKENEKGKKKRKKDKGDDSEQVKKKSKEEEDIPQTKEGKKAYRKMMRQEKRRIDIGHDF